MKILGYVLFAFFFLLGRMFPIQDQKIVLFNGHNKGLNGNLLEIKKELEAKDKNLVFVYYCKREIFEQPGLLGKLKGVVTFFVKVPYDMATAGKIFLNDNFLPLGYCKLSSQVQVVQLWHGAGAFKKFGLSVEENPKVRKQVLRANEKITHLFVTSSQIVPYYEEAFGIPKERIYPTGVPITDIYLEKEAEKKGRQAFLAQYPELSHKKILLYTPTFRSTREENWQIMEHFPVEKLHKVLGEDWVILIKMHPKYPVENIPEYSYCYNMTNYTQVSDLYFASDLLVTDYSSTVVEYALLDKPILMYAYDLDKYDRGFYRDYEKNAPGLVAHNQEELLEKITVDQKENHKRHDFVKLQYDYKDNGSSKRIVHVINE